MAPDMEDGCRTSLSLLKRSLHTGQGESISKPSMMQILSKKIYRVRLMRQLQQKAVYHPKMRWQSRRLILATLFVAATTSYQAWELIKTRYYESEQT